MLFLTPRKKKQQVAQIADKQLLVDAWLLLIELLAICLLSMTTTKKNYATAFVVRPHHRHDHHRHHTRMNGRGGKLLTSSSTSSLLSSPSTFSADESIDSRPTRKKLRSGRRIGGRCNKRNQTRTVTKEKSYKSTNQLDGDGITTEIDDNNTCTMSFRFEDIFHKPCQAWNNEPLFPDGTHYFETNIVHDQYGRPWKLKVVFVRQQTTGLIHDDSEEPQQSDEENRLERILKQQDVQLHKRRTAFLWAFAGTIPITTILMMSSVCHPNDDQQDIVKNKIEEGVAFIIQPVPRKDDVFWYDRGYTDIPSHGTNRLYPIFRWLPDNYLNGIYLPKDVVQLSRSNDGNGSLLDVKFEFKFEDPSCVRLRNSVSSNEPPVCIPTGNLAYHKENEPPLIYEGIKEVTDTLTTLAEVVAFMIAATALLPVMIVIQDFFFRLVLGYGFLGGDNVVDKISEIYNVFS